MKKSISIILAAAIALLCACTAAPQPTQMPTDSGSTVPSTTVPSTTVPTTPATTVPDTQPTRPEETVPDIALPYRNPLNGMGLETPYTGRPVAVMLNNIISAMPMYGNSQADILFEVLAEGGITRFMGVFSDIGKVPKVGSIRSARKYYVDLALGFQALYVHFGGSTEAMEYLAGLRLPEMDGMKAGAYVFQDKDRLNAGYASEHTWFADGAKILQYAADRGVSMSFDTERDYGFRFDDTVIIGEPANEITAYFNMGGKPGANTKYTRFTYDSEARVYNAEQYKAPFVDGASKTTLSFSNVMVLYTDVSVQADGYLLTVATVGSGTGYYAAGGQIVPIRWSRAGTEAPFSFTLEDGSPLTFTPGHTYIGILPQNAGFAYGA